MLKNMKVRTSLLLGYTITIVVSVFIIVVSLFMMNTLSKNYQNILDALHVVLYHYIHTLIDENDSNRFVTMVINEIINNISNPYYKIQDTLKKVNLTPDYFRKLFFDETGKTPLQYLTHKRISYAKDLLRLQSHSGLSIHEISWNAGFSDNYYFSRVFKKYTGLSPKGWLRRESEKKKTEE